MKQHKQSDTLRLIHGKFERLVTLYQDLENKPRRYGTEECLTGSEIHLIEIVGDHDERLSVTDLARYANVTKGAISQGLKKLEGKGLTDKQQDPENSSRSIVGLTSKGKAAYYSHKHWHETMDGGYLDYLSGLDEEKTEFLLEFMTVVETFLQSVIDS